MPRGGFDVVRRVSRRGFESELWAGCTAEAEARCLKSIFRLKKSGSQLKMLSVMHSTPSHYLCKHLTPDAWHLTAVDFAKLSLTVGLIRRGGMASRYWDGYSR